MTLLYNVAFFFFMIAYLPHFLLKLKQAEDPHRLIRERLGLFSEDLRQNFLGKKIIWLHAVSVGEVIAMQKFIEGLTSCLPDYHIVLTTVTPTGQRIARKMEGKQITVCYFPFDVTPAVRSFFKTLEPEFILLAETEIWPNLLMQAGRFRVPVGILNARLSERSARRYERFSFFFRSLFRRLTFVFAQTAEDAKRFVRLGTEASRVEVLGNMKFDNVSLEPEDGPGIFFLKREWGFSPEDQILIAGSTHPGEEEMLLRVFLRLRDGRPHFKMVFAPRHVERSKKLALQLEKKGLKVQFSTAAPKGNFDLLLLDQMGVLKSLYAIADLVFVGGSLVRRGGQNPIEPASFKKAILHGPHIFNFEKIYQLFDQEGAALCVCDETQLAFALKRLLENESERTQLGENAFAVLGKLQGATEQALESFFHTFAPSIPSERTDHVELHAKLFPSAGGGT